MMAMKFDREAAGGSQQLGFVLIEKVMADVKQPQDMLIIKAHASHIIDLAFTADSRYLLSAGMDNLVHQWSVDDWSLVQTYAGHEKSVNSICLTSEGNRFITASSDQSLLLWGLGIGEPLEMLSPKGASVWLSESGRYLATLNQPWVTVMDLRTREVLDRFKPFPKRTSALVFHPEEKWLAVGGQGDAIKMFSVPGCEQVYEISQAHQGFVLSLAFSPDGTCLASTGYEQKLILWKSEDWRRIGEIRLENQGVQLLAFSPEGNFLAVASDHRLTLVDMRQLKISEVIELDPKGVYCLAFSPDSRWLVCGSADKRLRIWKWRG
jgi:WD40 repeat protein